MALSDTGGGTDTSASQTFTIDVTPVNDAPVLTGDVGLTPIPRNTTNPAGDAVADSAGPGITDADPGAPTGIAVVGSTGTANGTCQYSTDGGQSWLPLGTPSGSAARLLGADDMIRFVPATGFVGTVALTYRAWDQTTGTAGTTADLTGGVGGSTAFRSTTGAADLQVGVLLTPVAEDTKSPRGDKVDALVNTFVTDADAKARTGIAVIGVTSGSAGAWQYSIGGAFKPLVASPDKAVLLRNTDKVRFVPAPNATGMGTLRYHAWDQATGKAGGTADLTAGTGGGTAFSAARAVGFVQVTAVNDAPVLDVGGEPPLTRVLPTATDPVGDLVGALIGSAATDAERDPVGMAVTAVTGKGGKWQFRVNGSTDLTDLGSVSARDPEFLAPTNRIRFFPTSGVAGTARLSFKAWDGTAVSKATETGTLLVTTDAAPPANTAPVLDTTPTPALTPVLEDTKAPAGDPTGALLGQAVTDPDAGTLRGLAVTRPTGAANGTWQFSTNNGRSWVAVGAASDSNALLLRDTDRLRFVPAKDFNGNVSVTYRAWDRTRGTAGARADLTVATGGSSAFSVASETATVAVGPVNDAPILNTGANPALTPVLPTATNPDGDLVSSLVAAATDAEGDSIGITITAATGKGTWEFQTTGSPDWAGVGAGLVLAPTNRVRFRPTDGQSGMAKLSYKAWDGALASTAVESVSLVVNATDDRPVLSTAGSPTLTPVRAGDPVPYTLVSALLGTAAADADPGADVGIAVTAAPTTSGTWEVIRNGTPEVLGLVSARSPVFLRATDQIRFVPAAGFVGSVKLSFKAWDAGSVNPTGPLALSAATETAVVVVNSAPVLQA